MKMKERSKERKDDMHVKMLLIEGSVFVIGHIQKTGENNLDKFWISNS